MLLQRITYNAVLDSFAKVGDVVSGLAWLIAPQAMLGHAELTIKVPPCQLGYYHQGRGCKVAKTHTRCELAAN